MHQLHKGYRTHNRTRYTDMDQLIEQLLELKNPDFKKIMDFNNGSAKRFAESKELRNLKSNQLRKFFDRIKNIENKIEEYDWKEIEERELPLLNPLIIYNQSRNLIPRKFSDYMTRAIKRIIEYRGTEQDKKEMFKNFVKILEAIVAYHKPLEVNK